MKQHYYNYWSKIFDLELNTLLDANPMLNKSGRYITKHGDKYIYFYQDLTNSKKILTASLKNQIMYNLNVNDLSYLNSANINNFKNLHLAFHDIDYGFSRPTDFIKHQTISTNLLIKKINAEDTSTLDDFLKLCSEDDIDTLDLDLTNDYALGAYINNQLIGVSRYVKIRETQVADITVLIAPMFRNQKSSIPLVSEIVENILSNDLCPKYRVKEDNLASMKIAEKLGFQQLFHISALDTEQSN
ncbi:hypothetical protein CIK05_01280 [Bdellovibrio sp. qaytius]|nr:hypothetical protein CIK05_01280 [Bdellovibrio sp. qaytius]